MSNAAQKLVVPTDLWKHIATTLGASAWNEVRFLRKAVHSTFIEAGVDIAKPDGTPPIMSVPLDLFNAASTYLGSKPHDAVDDVMTKISNFISLIHQQALVAAVPAEAPPEPISAETEPLEFVPQPLEADVTHIQV